MAVRRQRCAKAPDMHRVVVQFLHQRAPDVDIAGLVALGLHAVAVARIEAHADVAPGSAGQVGVENIRAWEGGQFLLAHTGAERETDEHAVVWVCGGSQQGLYLELSEELRDGLVEPRHDVAHLHAASGLHMAKESTVASSGASFVVKGQFGDPALAVRKRIELAHVQQPVAHRRSCETGDLEAVVTVGCDERSGSAGGRVVPDQLMRLQKAEVVVQGSAGARPGLGRADRSAQEVVVVEVVDLAAAAHVVPQQDREAGIGLAADDEVLGGRDQAHHRPLSRSSATA